MTVYIKIINSNNGLANVLVMSNMPHVHCQETAPAISFRSVAVLVFTRRYGHPFPRVVFPTLDSLRGMLLGASLHSHSQSLHSRTEHKLTARVDFYICRMDTFISGAR